VNGEKVTRFAPPDDVNVICAHSRTTRVPFCLTNPRTRGYTTVGAHAARETVGVHTPTAPIDPRLRRSVRRARPRPLSAHVPRLSTTQTRALFAHARGCLSSRQVGSCLLARKARASPPSPPPPPLLWEGSAPKLGTRRAPASARRAGRAGRHQTAPQARTSAKGTKSSSRAPVARARTAACICRARARTCRSSP
jgi:hypothetical protein